jgi:hypothetical protein
VRFGAGSRQMIYIDVRDLDAWIEKRKVLAS